MMKWSEYFCKNWDGTLDDIELADILYVDLRSMNFVCAEKIAYEADRAWQWVNDDERCHSPSKEHHFFEHMRTFIDELEQKEPNESR